MSMKTLDPEIAVNLPHDPRDPFALCEPNMPVESCDCCNAAILVADDPVFADDPIPVDLQLPTMQGIRDAMEISVRIRKTGGGTHEERLIAMLLDAFVVNAELLGRAVDRGLFGTGGDAEDDEKLAETLEIASDVIRAGFRATGTPDHVPASIRLDLGTFFANFDLDHDDEDEDAPTPTDFEA